MSIQFDKKISYRFNHLIEHNPILESDYLELLK